MQRYRIEFLNAASDVFAMHELYYTDDQAAIAGGHRINGSPPVGASFNVWRDDCLVHHHSNKPEISNRDTAREWDRSGPE